MVAVCFTGSIANWNLLLVKIKTFLYLLKEIVFITLNKEIPKMDRIRLIWIARKPNGNVWDGTNLHIQTLRMEYLALIGDYDG